MADIPKDEWIPEVPFDSSEWADVEDTEAWDPERLAKAAKVEVVTGAPEFGKGT